MPGHHQASVHVDHSPSYDNNSVGNALLGRDGEECSGHGIVGFSVGSTNRP